MIRFQSIGKALDRLHLLVIFVMSHYVKRVIVGRITIAVVLEFYWLSCMDCGCAKLHVSADEGIT